LTGSGLADVRQTLFELLPPRPAPVAAAIPARRVEADPVRVERGPDGRWIVRGRALEAVVERFDPANRDAVAYLQHHFASLGVNRLLKRAGAETGDDVAIAGAVFEYFDEEAADAEARAARSSEAAEQRAAERRYLAAQRRAEHEADDSETPDAGPDGSAR
jgi:Obg family GTPase CgtA-like protein